MLNGFSQDVSEFVIVPSSGGCFEVTIDGKLVFSKLREGRFPENEEILASLR